MMVCLGSYTGLYESRRVRAHCFVGVNGKRWHKDLHDLVQGLVIFKICLYKHKNGNRKLTEWFLNKLNNIHDSSSNRLEHIFEIRCQKGEFRSYIADLKRAGFKLNEDTVEKIYDSIVVDSI